MERRFQHRIGASLKSFRRSELKILPAALFEFFAAATWAWIVSSNFWPTSDRLRFRSRLRGLCDHIATARRRTAARCGLAAERTCFLVHCFLRKFAQEVFEGHQAA